VHACFCLRGGSYYENNCGKIGTFELKSSAMMHQAMKKLQRVREILRQTGGCAVAYSGGVDSSLLLAVAHEVLGPRCLAVIATSSTYSPREFESAKRWADQQGIRYVIVESEELHIPQFSDNPPDRCYYCKQELFSKVRQQAQAHGLPHIADGSNADDVHDHRPGMKAAEELGVLSPLKEAGMTKADIRTVAKNVYKLPMADKPAMACLASRFPYGSPITAEKLAQVGRIEDYLARNGFRVYRARHHGQVLRLELGPDEMISVMQPDFRHKFVQFAKRQGFTYVTMDLQGYRTGSMNESLAGPDK